MGGASFSRLSAGTGTGRSPEQVSEMMSFSLSHRSDVMLSNDVCSGVFQVPGTVSTHLSLFQYQCDQDWSGEANSYYRAW